ncbi:MAG TPA: hypothetical protein VEI82_01835, partial [Myxococcota bacterium]|nr:hypothetical protein [Myxococcota bacterium]
FSLLPWPRQSMRTVRRLASRRRFTQPVASQLSFSKGLGKQAYYAQIDLDQPKAYAYAVEVMAAGAVAEDGQESIRAFVEKRRPRFSS